MLYSFLISFVDEFSALNVFRYLTFRTGLSVMSSMIIVFLIGGPFIRFFSEGEEKTNNYMPNIKPCYLTGLETTFNSTTVAMHKGTGAPVEVDISLAFQEERVLVRQDLYENDSTIEESEGYYKDGDMGPMNKDNATNLIEKGVGVVTGLGGD